MLERARRSIMSRWVGRVVLAVLIVAPVAACGGVVEHQGGDGNPAPSGTTPPAPTPSGTTSPAPSPAPSPSPSPSPTTVPRVPGPPPGADVSCWSPGSSGGPPPLVNDGPCSLVGTWDYTASAGATGSLSFDPYGNWVGGSSGADLCASQTMHGTYTLDGSTFWFVTIHDSSVCGSPNWGMSKDATFDATCTHATMTEQYDNCTGARPEFNYDLTLTKR
jgi:hypothetical protein